MDAIRHPDSDYSVTVPEAAALEDWTREYGYRYFGRLAVKSPDGQLRVPIPALSPTAKERWLQQKSAAPAKQSEPVADAEGQFTLLPEIEGDKQKLSLLGISGKKADRALSLLCGLQPLINGDFAARGYRHKAELKKLTARNFNLSVRRIEDLLARYKENEDPSVFVRKTPGPAKGIYSSLHPSTRTLIQALWLEGHTKAQICREVEGYIPFKAKSPGCRYNFEYKAPSRATVEREIERYSALIQAGREGQDARKTACGHIERSYLDLAPLERVESDEVKLNLFAYDPRRPVNRKGEPWIRRYWLLTFYDARSIYPLVWTLCEGSEHELRRGIALEDEINLFVALVREFGVPSSIHSDRGRFRGREWGGEPYQQRIEKQFAPVNGILQRVGQLAGLPDGIRHNMPRVHNPRGTRLERFHRWPADWFRGKPGWIATIKERKEGLMPRGDADVERHKLWCLGKLPPGEGSPLWTRDEVLAEVGKMMEAWRDHNSEGTDMCGMTPRAVFVQCSPASGFPRISEEQLAFATAQHFENEHIEIGGIIELRDGTRYSHPLLAGLAGQKREVVRLRHDHSFITVLPAAKGDPTITAPRCKRVGMKDPDELARQMELQNRLEKLAGEVVRPLIYEPGAEFVEASKSADVIHPSEFMAAQEAPEPEPLDFSEISSPEWQSEGKGPRPKPWDFADLET
jgi:hypothetical protein